MISFTVIAIGLLIVVASAEGGNKAMQSKVQSESTLRAELRGNENGMILFDANPKFSYNRRPGYDFLSGRGHRTVCAFFIGLISCNR